MTSASDCSQYSFTVVQFVVSWRLMSLAGCFIFQIASNLQPRVQAKQSLTCMATSEDIELAATGYAHAAIRLHDLTAAPRAMPQEPGAAAANALTLDNETSAKDLWGHHGPVYGLSFSYDKRVLYSSGCDGTVRLWATELGANNEAANLLVWEGHNAPVWDVAACPNGHWLASGGADWTCKLWCGRASSCAMSVCN